MKTWKFSHKGHSIEVSNTLFSEQLLVDGELQDMHKGFALRSHLHGRLKSGVGAGEIVKVSLGGMCSISCVAFIDDSEVFRS